MCRKFEMKQQNDSSFETQLNRAFMLFFFFLFLILSSSSRSSLFFYCCALLVLCVVSSSSSFFKLTIYSYSKRRENFRWKLSFFFFLFFTQNSQFSLFTSMNLKIVKSVFFDIFFHLFTTFFLSLFTLYSKPTYITSCTLLWSSCNTLFCTLWTFQSFS